MQHPHWLVFGLLCAFFYASQGAQAKRLMAHVDPVVVVWSTALFALPFTLGLVAAEGLVPPQAGFWPALLACLTINGVSTVLYNRAIQISDLSLVVPLLSLTPVWMLVTSPFMLGEFPVALGVLGIAGVFAGALLLKAGEPGNWFAPFRAIARDRGARIMTGVSLLWSITANLDKLALQASNPATYLVASQVGFVVLLLPAMLAPARRRQFVRCLGGLALLGALAALMGIAQMFALRLTLAAYVIAMKRSGMLFSILYGHYLFRESGIRERLAGAAVMAAGMFLIAAASVGV